MYAGSSGYHDFFADQLPSRAVHGLAGGEAALLLDRDGEEPSRIGYAEFAVGDGITRVVSEGPDGRQEHEVSPVGAVLVGRRLPMQRRGVLVQVTPAGAKVVESRRKERIGRLAALAGQLDRHHRQALAASLPAFLEIGPARRPTTQQADDTASPTQ
jgi:hypothetical protein